MSANSIKLHMSPEHIAFFKDLGAVVVSYTPASGVVDTIKFGHKWLGKRKAGHRIAKYIKKRSRRIYIKSRGKRIAGKRRRPSGNAS